MTTADRLDAMREEFNALATTEERRTEILTALRDMAKAENVQCCAVCKHPIFHAPYHHALIPGHVYSEDGVREVGITGWCEHCFDRITAEPADEDYESHLDKSSRLVVIDPESREQAERLAKEQHEASHHAKWEALHEDTRANLTGWMQAALREYANPSPAKPPEPADEFEDF